MDADGKPDAGSTVPVPLPSRSRRDRFARLVARQSELATLSDALLAAKDGEAQFVFVSGAPGIGKSRLIEELAAMSRSAGVPIGIGRCHDGIEIPYLPLRDALFAADSFVNPRNEALLQLLNFGSRAAGHGRLMPAGEPATFEPGNGTGTEAVPPKAETIDRTGAPVWSGTLDDARGVADLYRNVLDLLIARLASGPLTLVIEDLHWSDAATLDLLGYLLTTIHDLSHGRSLSLLVVLTHRTDLDGAARQFVARAVRSSSADRLELMPLDLAQTRTLIEGLGVDRPAHALVDLVQSATRGNPLFVENVLDELQRSGRLQKVGGYTVGQGSSEALGLPEDLTASVARGALTISENARKALGTAALLGDSFSFEELLAILEVSDSLLRDWLEEARDLVHDRDGRFRFAHPLVRQALSSLMRPVDRRRAHARIANHLLEAQSNRTVADIAEPTWQQAHHLILAGDEVDRAQTEAVCALAASEAAQVFAWGNAASAWIGAALSATDIHKKANYHLEAALCYSNSWDWGPCVQQFDRALQLFRSAGDDVGIARVLASRARSRLPTNVYAEQLDYRPLEAAIDALGTREPALRGLLHSRIADAHWNNRNWEGCEASARTALKLAEEVSDSRLSCVSLISLFLSQYHTVRLKEATQSLQKSIVDAERTGLRWLENTPRQRLVHVLLLRGELDHGRAHHAIGLARCQETGDEGEASFALANGATLAAIEGNFDDVEDLAKQTLRAVERSAYPFGGFFALQALAYVRHLRGQWDSARDALSRIERPGAVFDEPGPFVSALVNLRRSLIDANDTDGADPQNALEARYQHMLQQARDIQDLGHDVIVLGAAANLIELAVEEQHHEVVQTLLPSVTRAYEAGLLFVPGWPSLMPRVIGIGLSLLGEREAAGDMLAEGEALAERLGAEPELARARLDLARHFAASPGAENHKLARRFLERSYRLCAMLGMMPFLQRAESLAYGLGLRLEPAERLGEADATDRKLLEAISAGRNWSELEDQLILERGTVDGRLKRLARRLDTDSTAETIAEAIERRYVPMTSAMRVPTTIVVTDIVGYTPQLELLGDERMQAVVRGHYRLLRRLAKEHSGTEISLTGDGIILAFRSAAEAVSCAVAIQRALIEFNQRPPEERVSLRIGVQAGELLPDNDERMFGKTLVATVRICSEAVGGQILISETVRKLAEGVPETMRDTGRHALKGFHEPVRLHEVVWHSTG